MSLGESDRPGPGPGETRALLRRGRVTVVGLGGVGGHAATALAISGVGALHVIDQGTVAQPDLNRQPLYAEADVGRAKVAAGADRLRQLNAGIEVTGKQAEISGAADLECIAGECDVLLLCARTPPDIAAWANLACLQARTPWISAGYAGPGVTVGTFVPGQGGCWQCARTVLASGRCRSDEPAPGRATVAPAAGIAGYLAASAALGMLTGSEHISAGRVDAVSLLYPDASFSLTARRRSDCPACAP